MIFFFHFILLLTLQEIDIVTPAFVSRAAGKVRHRSNELSDRERIPKRPAACYTTKSWRFLVSFPAAFLHASRTLFPPTKHVGPSINNNNNLCLAFTFMCYVRF